MARNSDSSDGLLRFIAGTLLIGGLGYGGGWFYTNVFGTDLMLEQKTQELAVVRTELDTVQQKSANQAMMIEQMGVDLETGRKEIARLDTSMRLLKTNYRVAFVDVLRQDRNPASGVVSTEFRFYEVDKEGQALTVPRVFRVDGDMVYFDYWVVKFDDELVEQQDPNGSNSLCLFRRLFGEFQEPHQGYTLDNVGSRPAAYGNGPINEYEQQIWSNFWTIANDPQVAASMGIRAAHGEAVAMRLKEGLKYQVMLRASDGLTVRPLPADEIRQPSA